MLRAVVRGCPRHYQKLKLDCFVSLCIRNFVNRQETKSYNKSIQTTLEWNSMKTQFSINSKRGFSFPKCQYFIDPYLELFTTVWSCVIQIQTNTMGYFAMKAVNFPYVYMHSNFRFVHFSLLSFDTQMVCLKFFK